MQRTVGSPHTPAAGDALGQGIPASARTRPPCRVGAALPQVVPWEKVHSRAPSLCTWAKLHTTLGHTWSHRPSRRPRAGVPAGTCHC